MPRGRRRRVTWQICSASRQKPAFGRPKMLTVGGVSMNAGQAKVPKETHWHQTPSRKLTSKPWCQKNRAIQTVPVADCSYRLHATQKKPDIENAGLVSVFRQVFRSSPLLCDRNLSDAARVGCTFSLLPSERKPSTGHFKNSQFHGRFILKTTRKLNTGRLS